MNRVCCSCVLGLIAIFGNPLIYRHNVHGTTWQGPVEPGSYVYQKGNKLCYVKESDVTSSNPTLQDFCIAYNLAGQATLAVRTYNRSLFLGDSGNAELERRFLDVNRQHIISYGSHYVGGVSVDWSSNTVYWSETVDGTILAAYTEGFGQYVTIVLDQLEVPKGVVVDPKNRHLYWSEAGSSPKIMRSIPDGSNQGYFLRSADVGEPGDLAIDLGVNQRLFWVDALDRSIKSVSLEGTDIKIVVTSRPTDEIITGITLSEFLIAWAQIRQNQGLYWANKTDGTVIRSKQQTETTADIVYYGRYPRHNPAAGLCGRNNGDCAHICLHIAQNRVCRCSFGYHTTDGGKTCTTDIPSVDLTSSFLLVSDIGWWDVYLVPLNPTGTRPPTKLLGSEDYPISV